MANVKVALRVRPLSKREIAEEARIILNVDDKIARIRNIKLDYRADGCGDTRERFLEFGFDYCYCSADPDDPKYASQEVVFQDLGTTVLSEAIKGYNVCLFAYGQTGSGKTYTMMGTPTSFGLTPRICEGLFCYNADSLGAPSSCRIEVSFLEIYNERVRDLLHQADQKKPYTLRVREHPEKGPYVQGLSKHVVTTYEQVVALLEEGMENRITAATHIHDASSRSHAIFTIQYTQAILEDNCPSEISSKVNLVDLAGSERASPNYCKDRLTEGSNINRSLVTLGIVISALAQNSQMSSSCQSINSIISDGDSGIQGSSPSGSSISGSKRQPFVPYRDSILTWLLKDSLGGNSKTIMIATVSPSSSSYNETMSTLRYASNAKNIINKPRVNEDANVKLIRDLREEINRLKAMLRNFEMRTVSPAFSEERDGSLTELVRQNELKIEQLTKDWTDKWTDKAALMEQYSVDINQGKARVTIDSGLPHLIAMDDDILSTGVVIYHLKEGTTNIGKEDHDIVLQGECIEQDHCIIENNFGVVELRPVSGALCTVNGQKVTEDCRLSQGAVIVLGKSLKFRFNHPAQAAVLRQMRSSSQASFVSDHSLDWLDLSGDYSSSTENSVILNTSNSTEILSGENRQQITELESSYQQQVEEQQRYVELLKRQIRLAQVKGEKELEQEQTLLNQQIQENQRWLVKENQRLTTVCQQRKESSAQTEAKTYAEVEIQNCVQTEIQPSPEEVDRKQLLQLELLRKCSLRKAERNIRRKRVKFQLERIVKKQKLLEAKKNLQQLEAVCWINDDALKPTYLHVPKLQDPAVHSTSLERSRSSNIISYYRRRSLPWTLQTLPTYSAILKRKCRSELVQRSKTREKKKSLRAVSIDCLHKTSSTFSSGDEVENESSCVETPSAQAEKRTINFCISHSNFGATLFPSDPQMSKKRQKMDKAGGRPRGLSSRPTEPPKKRNVRPPVNTGTKDTKLKATKSQSQLTVGIPRKNAVLEKSRLTAKSESIKSPPEKLAKNIQSSPGPGKSSPNEAYTVKTARRNMTSSTPNTKGNTKSKPIHGANKISSSADNVSKVNNHHKDVTERRWMSTERLNRGLSRPNIQRLEHWKEDDNGDSSDSESFYSVDSLSSVYVSALNEQLKQEERERKKHSRRNSDSEDSQMSQDSLVERENKKDRHNKRKSNRYKTIVTPSNSSKSLTEDPNSLPFVTTGSMTTGFSKSFSLDSLADADEVPEVDSSEELPAEIFWTLQSPRCLNINDDNQKNVDIPNTRENTVLEKSASFYLNDETTTGYKVTSTTYLNVPNVKSHQIHLSPPVIYSEETLHGLSHENCIVEPAVNALDQDFSSFDNGATKPDSDFTRDEANEVLTKNIVIKNKPRASPDIQEELNAQCCHSPEPLCKNLNECNIEQNQPNTKVQCLEDQKSVECMSFHKDCHILVLDESISKSNAHSDCHDLSDSLMEGQTSFPNIDKNNVDLESIGSSRTDANTIPQLFLEPATDDVCNKDDISVNTSVNSDLKISVETCSQYINDNHKESVESKEVIIKSSIKPEISADEELTECDKKIAPSWNTLNVNKSRSTISLTNENQDMKKDIHSKRSANGLLSDSSCFDEECKPQKMFVLHLAKENDETHYRTDVTMKSVDHNVTQGGLSYVQTDYLNNQIAVLSDSLESEKMQNMVTGTTNALQTEEEPICSGFGTTDLVSQMPIYSDVLDLNDNRGCKRETQQHFSDTYNIYENKAADALQRLIIDGPGKDAAVGNADISMSVVLANQLLSTVKTKSHTMSVELSETININPPKICNNLLQQIENLGKDDSRDSRAEVWSVESHKDTDDNVFLSDSPFLHSCTSLDTDLELPHSSPVINLTDLPLSEHSIPRSSTIPGEYIPAYNNPEHEESKVNGCFCKHSVNILSNPSEIFQLTALYEKTGELQHNVLDINSNEEGVSCSSCETNTGSLSSLHNAHCALTSNSSDVLIETKSWKEKGILLEERKPNIQSLSADSQQLHGLDTNIPYYASELLNCKNGTDYCIQNSKQLQEICPSGQDMYMKSSQNFNSIKNDHQGLPSGIISTVTGPDIEDDKNARNEIADQKHQEKELRMATITFETEGSFPLIKQINEDYENVEKTNNDDGKQCASNGRLKETSPSNKQAMIQYGIEANDKDHGKVPASDKHDNYVTNCYIDIVTENNEQSNSADPLCGDINNHYCAGQPLTQDYEAIMQSERVSEATNSSAKAASIQYQNVESLANNAESEQCNFGSQCLSGFKKTVENQVNCENHQSKSSSILKCKEGKLFVTVKSGESGLGIPHGTGIHVTKNESIQDCSAVYTEENVLIPTLLHGSPSAVSFLAEEDCIVSFMRASDRQGHLQEAFEESEQTHHNIVRESYQTKDQKFNVKAQEKNCMGQQTLNKLPCENTIVQKNGSPLTNNEFKDKTRVIASQNPEKTTCESESTYSSLPYSTYASTLSTATSSVNSSACIGESNEKLENIQNDGNICQYRLSKNQEEKKPTEIFLSCQQSSFRPYQEMTPKEKGSIDYGSGHTCVGSVSTTNEWEHKLKSKSPNSPMDKGTLQSTDVLDGSGVNIISGYVLEQPDPSLHVVYRIRDNEGIKKNSCMTKDKADCREYLQLNRSPEISSGDEDTETSSSLASSGLTSLKIRSLESLSSLNEGILEMNRAVNTDDSGDFSHHAFSGKNMSLYGCLSSSVALGKSQMTEYTKFPPDGLTSSLNSEPSPQRLGSSPKTMCNEVDHSNLESKDCLPHNEHAHFNDEGTGKKAYIPIKLLKDSSQQTQTSLEEMAQTTEGLHFSSSDINPFVHSWQQEVSPRAGWRNCSFNSASDVSCSKIQTTAARLLRCSSVDEGLNSHSSPFNSHLSSYANAKPASSTISSFGENDSRHDLNSLEGFQDHLLDNTVDIHTTNDMEFVGTSGSRVKFEDYSQLDEIMILYTSESETCNENDQRISYEQRTHTKPRYRKTTKHQRSSTDLSSSRKMKSPNPVSWSNVQSMSMHLSQLLQETSQLLGNLSQHPVENVPRDAIRLQNHSAESLVKKTVKDSFTQTFEDKGMQTDKHKINRAISYSAESNSFLSPSEINVIVKVVGADSSTLTPDNTHLTGVQSGGQAPKVRTQSLPNLHGYVPSKPAGHVMSKSPHVRASVPFLNGSKELSAGSLPISSPTSSPVSVILNQDSSGGQTLRCHTTSQGNTMMVDRASSPILTLRASKKPFTKCEPEKHSSENNPEKVSRHRKRRERGNCDLQMTSSHTETDSESNLSFDRGNTEPEYKALHCSSLRESPKKRIATHKVQRYKSEGCILQNKYSPITNQFSSNSEIFGYDDRKDFRCTQTKKMPTTTFAALPPWECPQSLGNLSQVVQPVLDRHRQPLTRTTMKECGAEENDLASTTIASSNSYAQNENCPYSPSQVSGIDLHLQEDGLSVVESECDTDILLGKEPTLANSCKSNNYSLQDLPFHNKFSNWSGVHGSSPRNGQFLMSYPNLSIKESSTCRSQEVMESRSREIERLQQERAKVMSAIHLEMNPQPLTVQLAEAKLSYGIGETDALLRVIQTGKMDSQDQVSIKKQLYDRHMKVIENLRKEREERLQSFRRSRSLSPQKQLSASQTSLLSLRESELPSRRREYLQQLRRDVVDSTRIQEPRRRSAHCPSEIEAMLKDYQKAREEARTEIARARDKLRERAEQEKRRLLQSTSQKEDTKVKTLVSTSTLFTNSSLSLSSGPTSGYNSGMTATPAKGSKSTFQEAKTLATGLDLEPGSGRGRSAVRNCYLLVPTQNASVPDPSLNQLPSNKNLSAEASLTRSARPHGPLLLSTPILYQDLATQVQASAMAEVMAACSYDTRNLFNGQAAAGWIYQTTEKDVLVYYKAFSSPTKHAFIGAGIIKKPLHNVWDMVKDVHVRRLYDQSILSACVHQRVSSTVQLVHVVMDMSLCYLKQPRDFCCITAESKEEKCYSLCFQSVHNESMPRPTKDAVRGEILPSAWILQPDSSHGEPVTHVIYMVQADLGAPAIPSRLLGVVSKRQALVISSLANFFSR